MKIRVCLTLLILAAAALASCGRSPQTTFYTLSPAASAVTAPPGKAPTIAIAAVTLPELVDRPQLVLPDSGARVLILESHRWAEPLKSAIPRILAENLSRLLGGDRVSFHPQYASVKADYRIFVDIKQLEAQNGKVVLDALFTVKPSGDGAAFTRRSSHSVQINGEGPEPLVAAYSRALAGLAADIAAALPVGAKP